LAPLHPIGEFLHHPGLFPDWIFFYGRKQVLLMRIYPFSCLLIICDPDQSILLDLSLLSRL